MGLTAALAGKQRLDVAVVGQGIAETRSRAKALILAGDVLVNGAPVRQAGALVQGHDALALRARPRFVGRGGEKLAHALDALAVSPRGLDCLDVGASTGGFSDVLLQRGAKRVIALDVGYGQLHPRIRGDDRVTVLERVNARQLPELPYAPVLITCDVSFISAVRVLRPAIARATPDWQALVLVKPQFEAGRADAPKGVVRDPDVHRHVLRTFCWEVAEWSARVAGIVDSGHPGPKGNREFVVHLIASETPTEPDEIERRIQHAVG